MPATADPFHETSEPQFGPAPVPLAGKELPSFRYALGAMATKQFDGGTAKEANVEGFPVSEKLAGVYMTLEAGALRELHWHANAAEWAYMLEAVVLVVVVIILFLQTWRASVIPIVAIPVSLIGTFAMSQQVIWRPRVMCGRSSKVDIVTFFH